MIGDTKGPRCVLPFLPLQCCILIQKRYYSELFAFEGITLMVRAGMVQNQEDKKVQAVREKLAELIAHRFGELTVKVHDGEIRQIELVRKANTVEQIEKL